MDNMKRALTFSNHYDAAIGIEKRLKTTVSDQHVSEHDIRRKTNEEYTVGWVCAIPTEYAAARAILDEIHGRPEKVSHANQSDYTLGRIGKHNVVIAALPYGEYGTASAATVAGDMSHNFPNIKIRLMVGIGGGAPSERHDIRLGDIVVSTPRDGKGGVLQYDFGKTVQDQPFQITRILDQPPMLLRSAISGLIAQYEHQSHRLEETINNILERTPNMQKNYCRPPESSDRLYYSTSVHPLNSASDCTEICDDNSLIVRAKRNEEKSGPVIHYGLIASANQLMKDAVIRDKLSSEYDVLCFEMEAGGLMNQFPCLVIRGICDYSDSHKNKSWQGYAAMTAAAYAKDLINRLSPTDIGAPEGISSFSPNQTEQEGNIPHTVSVERIRALLESLRFDQIDARQMTIKSAHAKTCRWLLRKPEYLDWLDATKVEEHHGFLWIKGKPGTGKSTLMKFVLHNAKKSMRGKVIIYFFFNARGEDLEKSTIGMYRSLLLQLLEKLPALQHILELPRLTASPGEEYQWNTEMLMNLLDQAIQNLKGSSVVCFIDALDECDEDQIRTMMKFFERVGDSIAVGSFRVCFSSRHYPHISISKGLNLVLEGQEGHTQDMISYINSELQIGSSALANQIRTELQEKASGVFIWVVLVVGILNKEHDKGRMHALRKRLQEIPADLHALFRDILTRDNQDTNELLLCIQWVLFSKQPLRPEQLYFAMLSGDQYEWNYNEITVFDMERFILNSSKGLTEVTKSKSPTVQFIHESVKDYLMKENGLRDIWPDLEANVCGESHECLKQCCLNYIDIGKAAYLQISDSLLKAISQEADAQRRAAKTSYPFLEYAVRNVLLHANEAEANGVNQAGFLKAFQYGDWIQLDNFFEKYDSRRHKRKTGLLYILAEYNMVHLIRRWPNRLSFLKIEQERYGTPLFAALANNSTESVREFLDAHLEIEPSFRDIVNDYYCDGIEKNNLGRGFTFSLKQGFRDFVRKGATLSAAFCLRLNGTNVDLDFHSRNSLYDAVQYGHKSIVELFINERTSLDYQRLLLTAATHGQKSIAELLLSNGAMVDGPDKDGNTPLLLAIKRNHLSVAELLLSNGAKIECQDSTALLLSAIKSDHSSMAKLLLSNGAKIEYQDSTALLLSAIKSNHLSVAELLLSNGAKIEYQDSTALLLSAIKSHHSSMAKLLLSNGANIECQDNDGNTPLLLAIQINYSSMAELLLTNGANMECQDNDGNTPLLLAIKSNHNLMAELLLTNGAEIDTKDRKGRTSLSYAVQNYIREAIARLLLEKGADVDAKDNNGRTPLSYAAEQYYFSEATIKLLLENGADVDAKDNSGRTPLSYAAAQYYTSGATTKLLLENGADVDAKDNNGRTPLSYASEPPVNHARVQ